MQEDLIFDLGMHKGEDTEFYLKKGYRVVGVEADPDLAEHCRQRFAARISDGTVRIIEGAIVGQDRIGDGTVKFYRNPTVSVWGTVDPQWRDRNVLLGCPSVDLEVRCLDLGAILSEHGVPFYLKIYLEGGDRLCLDYLRGFQVRPQYRSLEDEKVELSKLKQDLERLCSLGYRKFRTIQQQSIPDTVYKGVDRLGRPITHRFEDGATGPFGDDLGGEWMTRAETWAEYRRIFEMYGISDEDGLFSQNRDTAKLLSELTQRSQWLAAGWYDTHASL